MENTIQKHDKIVLMFSGGKDSLACLFLLKKYWDKINVMWVNTGAAFPEIIQLMDKIKEMVPHFTEVTSHQSSYIEAFGYPSDVVPINHTTVGELFTGKKKNKISIYLDCCAANISFPLRDAAALYGATLIIRGQKSCDGHKAPIVSNQVVGGIQYLFPIQDWSNEDVFAYLRMQDFPLPEFYSLKATSLDCWNCTAYCADHADKLQYMKKHHPKLAVKLLANLAMVKRVIAAELMPLNNLLEATHGR